MKKIIKYAIILILFGLLVMECIYFMHYRRIYRGDRQYQYVSSDKGIYISQDDIDEDKDILGSYVREDNVSVMNGQIRRTSEADLLIVDFDFIDMLGQYCGLHKEDKEGCIISSKLSYDLYGTENGRGNVIKIGDEGYSVRNVIDSGDAIIIRQQNPDTEDIDQENRILVLDTADELYRNEMSDHVTSKYGISDADVYYVSDYQRLYPGLALPSKWSDFDRLADGFHEIQAVKDHMTYGNKDILELQYYKNYNIMKRHFWGAVILLILWIPVFLSEIKYLVRK